MATSQVTTPQLFNFPSGNFPKVRLGLSRRRRLHLGGRAQRLGYAWGRVLRLRQTWEVVAWEIAQLGSFHLGKYPFKKAFGNVPNINICIYLKIEIDVA